jgi:ABC-type multidrug transport system fused ATPase/permease subunit
MTRDGSVNGKVGRGKPDAGKPAPQTKQTKQAKRRRGVKSRLIALLRPELPRLTAVFVLGIASVGLLVAGPWVLGDATNILFGGILSKRVPAGLTKAQAVAALRAHHQDLLAHIFSAMNIVPGTGVDFTRLGQVLGIAALMYLLSSLFGWAMGYVMAGVAVRTVYHLRQRVAEKLGRLSLGYFDRHPHGDILSRATNDMGNIFTALQEGLTPLLTSALTVVGLLGMMFWISPVLAPISLVTILLSVPVTSLIARRSKREFIAQWEQTGSLNGLVEETHTGHSLVLAFGQRGKMIEDFERRNDRLYKASFRAQFLSGMILPAILFIGNLNFVIIAVPSGYQVATGVITLGAAQALVLYSRRFTIPVAQIAGQMNTLQSGLVSAERVFEFLDVPEELDVGEGTDAPVNDADSSTPCEGASRGGALREGASLTEPTSAASRVELDHVRFRYDPGTPLIEDFTLKVDPGQTIAIVGPTGAGKTTIVNLLMRFYEIGSGRILLDGVDYRRLSRDQVRRKFGMVLQDTWLFSGTIRDNIAYGKEGASDDEIVAAARAAYVDDFVRTLPDGYATVLEGDGSSISAGQKQLLTIARAFLADPGILILDEATSNIDTRTEVLIQDALARLRSRRTSFIIAHRLSTIRNADVIVVMDAGRIVEQGTHDQLLRQRGIYHDLYNSQFSGSADLVMSRRS